MKLPFSFFSILLLVSTTLNAQIKLPRLVRDSMVLQRNANVKIWGWASPREKIKVDFLHKKYKIVADKDGNWHIVLSPMKAGGPYTMSIDGKNHIALHDILIGDVWLCAGQSNMQHNLELHKYRYAKEIANADYPQIRQFLVPQETNLQKPESDLKGGYWKYANPQNLLQFSAVGYFFAKALYDKYHVPIGFINSSVGGTPIEAWTSEEGLKELPSIEKIIEKNKDTSYVNETNRKAMAINFANRVKPEDDKGLAGKTKWYDPSYIPKEWYRINIPGYWEDQGIKNLNGVVWYRREIDVPTMTGNYRHAFYGKNCNADFVYVNGVLVGNKTYMYPERRYDIPPGLLKPGKNLIVIRVINYAGKGGFVPDKPYYIFAGKDTVDLMGYWQYKVGDVFDPRQRFGGSGGFGFSPQNAPTALSMLW